MQGFSPGPRWLHLSRSLVCPQLQERQGGRKIGGRRSPCSLLLWFWAVWVVQPLRREAVLGKGRLCKLTHLCPAERCWGPLWTSRDRVLGCHRELPCFAPLPSTVMLLSSRLGFVAGANAATLVGAEERGGQGVAAQGIWF